MIGKKSKSQRNVLVFFVCNDHSAIEVALEAVKQGDNVYALLCDKSTGICIRNPYGNGCFCRVCNSCHKKIYKSYLHDRVNYINLSDIISAKDEKESDLYDMDFTSISELKNIEYHAIEVGYGAFSDFASLTRNVMPDITPDFKEYIQFHIKNEIKVISALERFVKEKKNDLIVFHNGRFAFVKPFLGVAVNNGIDYIATEHFVRENMAYPNFFFNDVPHSVEANIAKAQLLWKEMNPEERTQLGVSFYEKRRHGIVAGDKVYIDGQVVNKIPDDWDESVENISIFNSSEDEFCAVSKDFDKKMLFSNQFEALHAIFEHYKGDRTKHFYLRIHPNLKAVRFKSHLALYNLVYDNVTIISPESPISSYSLMDKSDKVIVFNSTMGLESAYWNKPVIALTKFYSTELNLAYSCETVEDLWKLLDCKDLKPLKNDNAIIIGNYFLRKSPLYKNIDVVKVKRKFLKKDFTSISISKIFGSYLLYDILQYCVSKNFAIFNLASRFKTIPESKPQTIDG